MGEQGIKGPVFFMAFLMFLLLAFWCLNMFKHISSGRWTKSGKVIDITVLVALSAVFVGMIIPLFR